MPEFDHEQIARIAYRFWEQRGRPLGSSEVDWCRAEAEMTAHRRLMARIGVGSLALRPDDGPWQTALCEPAHSE